MTPQAEANLMRYLNPRNPPIYTFDLFKNVQEQLEKANKTDLDEKTFWMIEQDISGQLTTNPIPTGERTKPILHSLHRIAFGEDAQPGWHTLEGSVVTYGPDNDNSKERCCDPLIEKIIPHLNDLGDWWKSEHMQKLEKHLRKNAKNMERVDTIAGFGLGRLQYTTLTGEETIDKSQHPGVSWLQHSICRFIKKIFEEEQENTIKVVTQDPKYCPRCIETLRGQDAMDAKRSATWLFASPEYINKHTFVVSIAPSAPVLQIIFDLTADIGGPAGILCDTFDDEDNDTIINPWPFEDPPNIRALEYAQNAKNHDMVLELDDSDSAGIWRKQEWTWNVFGNSSVYLKKKPGTHG